MTTRRFILRIHGWIAIIAGVPVVLWVVSGLVMAWFPIDEVRGRHLARNAEPPVLDATNLLPLTGTAMLIEGGATQITLRSMAGAPVYELANAEGAIMLVDARTGDTLSPLNETRARQIALHDYAGSGNIIEALLITDPAPEDRTASPVWRIRFDDVDETRLFISPDTGKVLARRTATWRLYDFFWMLHIMDFSEREDFNHPALIAFAALSVIVAASGLPLLWWHVIAPAIRRRRRT